jgi:hypothetical protein
MKGEEEVCDALRIGGGAEDFLFVVTEFGDPVRDVRGAVGEIAVLDPEFGADYDLRYLRSDLLARVVGRAEAAGERNADCAGI